MICKINTGTKPYHVRWVKEGIKEGLLPHMKVVQESTLLIQNAKMSDTGNYSCHVNNSFSSASLTFATYIYGELRFTVSYDELRFTTEGKIGRRAQDQTR